MRVNNVHPSDLRGFCKHSKRQIFECYNKTKLWLATIYRHFTYTCMKILQRTCINFINKCNWMSDLQNFTSHQTLRIFSALWGHSWTRWLGLIISLASQVCSYTLLFDKLSVFYPTLKNWFHATPKKYQGYFLPLDLRLDWSLYMWKDYCCWVLPLMNMTWAKILCVTHGANHIWSKKQK